MKRKLTSIFLSTVLISQVGVIPQTFAKCIEKNQEIIVKDEDVNSKIVYALKCVGGAALTATGLYFLWNHFKPRPEVPAPIASAPVVAPAPAPQVRPAAPVAPVPQVRPAAPVVAPAPAPSIDDIPLAHTVHPVQVGSLEQRIRDFEAILDRYLNGPALLQQEEVTRICNEAIPVLERESSFLKIEGPTIVVGDIHGNIGSLEYSCRKFLREVRNGKSILFLGDYVDRGAYAPGGPNSIKNITLLLQLKTMFPDKVFLLRGNHEDININKIYGFFDECRTHYDGIVYNYSSPNYFRQNAERIGDYDDHVNDDVPGMNIYNIVNRTFNSLSLAAVINNTTFCVHGGISPELNDLCQIHRINKPLSSDDLQANDLAIDLLWSDPNNAENGFAGNGRGAGKLYGHDAVNEFFARYNLRRIVRSHQYVGGHNDVFGDGSVITLFSAPDYYTTGGNIGEIMDINGDNIEYEQIHY